MLTPDNPYAAPQTPLEQYREPVLLVGELPFLANHVEFQVGAARAREALANAVALVLLAFVLALLLNALLAIDAVAILFIAATVLIAQRICWKFFAGLSQMAAASRLFLRGLLNTAKFAFLIGWVCYMAKILIVLFISPDGMLVFSGLDILDSLAGSAAALCLGIAGWRLGNELHDAGLKRRALLTLLFFAGSQLLFLLLDTTLLVGLPKFIVTPRDILNDVFLLFWLTVLSFLIGFFVLMSLLRQMSQLSIRNGSSLPPLAETVLDEETIARRRRIAKGQG
jgi:hypothetical protein